MHTVHCPRTRRERPTKPKRNAMKAEINQRIAALLENPEIEAVRVEVRTAFEVYRDAREKDVKVQKEAWDKEERPAPEPGEEPVRFEYQADEEDTRNNEMYAAFREREKAWREKVAAEQRANLEKKQTILGKLQELVANEENIGTMSRSKSPPVASHT